MQKLPLLLIFLFLLSCSGGNNYIAISGYAQGGTYTVKLNLKDVDASSEEIAGHIDSLLTAIDFSLSGYNKMSLLSRFNEGGEITPDELFTRVTDLSEQYSRDTDGAFDVWSAPLFELWGFGFKNGEFPSDGDVSGAIERCKERKTLNFNAIAQGFSCDVVADYLKSLGVKDMLVDIGEIYCQGHNPSGKGWSIAVDNPVDGNNTPGADIRCIWDSEGKSCGVVTSGNYRKFYVRDGKKYSHTIDPRTGRPVEHNLLSATIVAPTAAQADAYATACMVMGPRKAREFIESREDIEGYLICSDSTWTSPGFCLRMP